MVKPHPYRSFKKEKLVALLKQRRLPVTGLKTDLILRLETDDEQDIPQNSLTGNRVTYRGISYQPDLEGNTAATGNGVHLSESPPDNTIIEQQKMLERLQRDNLVLWRQPLTTIQYFFLECTLLVRKYGFRLLRSWRFAMACVLLAVCLLAAYSIDGPHQENVLYFEKKVTWCLYWVGLGILSSVGLGTGLHTFVLYLGPHIASVTLAAFECNSVDFPEPPYPNQIICPLDGSETAHVTLWTIMSKVRLEAMMWGAGTAIGELPPYFMARAARLSGRDSEDDEFEELEELLMEQQTHPQDMNFLERAKLGVHRLVQRVGFFGILLCASIPNPLFDLAGITCGHFLIPFWTFFGATLIGKAIIKMHIQKLFVIFAFSEHHVQMLVDLLRYIPTYGETLQAPFREYLAGQKLKLHNKLGNKALLNPQASWLSWTFEKVIVVMVVYFLVSIVNSMAQSYHKTLCKDKRHKTQEMKA